MEFRKRLTDEILVEINEMIFEYNHPEDSDSGNGRASSGEEHESGKEGTLILDATCAPQNISYPQDINLLNEARKNLEQMIDTICATHHIPKPRTYRKKAHKQYLAIAKQKKRSKKSIRKAIKQQLQYVRRDIGFIESFQAEGKYLSTKEALRFEVI